MRYVRSGPGFVPTRVLAALLTTLGFSLAHGTAEAKDPAGSEWAQPARKLYHSGSQAGEAPAPAVAPRAKPQAEKPTQPESLPEERTTEPDDEEDVSPGENPASCDGCELAGFALSGSLWGLFGFPRRRGGPRTVLRGLQSHCADPA